MNITQGELSGAALTRPDIARGAPEVVPQPPSVFSADRAAGPDQLGRNAHAGFLAEVVTHGAAETPLCIGIFGPAGSGKSSFLDALLGSVGAIDRAATEAGLATPFCSGLVVAHVVAVPGVPAALLLRDGVAKAMAPSYPRLVSECLHAGFDPREVAREAAEKLNALRGQLDAERQTLDALVGRQARLSETVLFETTGSSIDTYARGNRGRIERRFRSLGITGEPVVAFKDSVREAHEAGSPVSQAFGWLRAFWNYRGQGRLLVLAAALLLAAWGLGALVENQPKLVDAVRSSGDKMASVADWLDAHWHWLTPARKLLQVGAFLCVAANILRGIGYLLPVHRGVRLLRGELENRRREFDSRVAHQARRVDALARDVERAGQHAAEAEARLTARTGSELVTPSFLRDGAAIDPLGLAQSFFAAAGRAIQEASVDRNAAHGASVPTRIVVGLDGLDDLPSNEAAAVLQTARGLLNFPGLVLITAADREHLAAGLAETDPALASNRLQRLVQLPFDLGADENWSGAAAYARALLMGKASETDPAPSREDSDIGVSALDRPWSAAEALVIEAVAPLAATTPRGVKRLVNLYRIARADPFMRDADAKDLAALALGLALQSAGLPPDLGASPAMGDVHEAVLKARRTIGAALGMPFGALDGQLGMKTARSYSAGR